MRNPEIFEYKGHEYELIGFAKMKDPETRKWRSAVLYRNKNNPSQTPYCRDAQEFVSKFKAVRSKKHANELKERLGL